MLGELKKKKKMREKKEVIAGMCDKHPRAYPFQKMHAQIQSTRTDFLTEKDLPFLERAGFIESYLKEIELLVKLSKCRSRRNSTLICLCVGSTA